MPTRGPGSPELTRPVAERLGARHHTGMQIVGPHDETHTMDAGEGYAAAAEVKSAGARRYVVAEVVGEGGMGRVARASDQTLLRDVALKTLRGEAGERARARFLQEARVAAQLDHPHVLPVYDLGYDEQGAPFFTMKLIPRHDTLADVIARLRAGDRETQARWTFERRVQVVQMLAHALHYAHLRGVVHRDIKPQNVVVGAHGEVFLVDWGVAKVLAEDAPPREPPAPGVPQGTVEGGAPSSPAHAEAADAETAAETADAGGAGTSDRLRTAQGVHTEAGSVVGTLPYMAPEQLRDASAVSPRTDVYALCAVLYELLTLNYYLGHLTPSEVGSAILLRTPRPAEGYKDPRHGRVPRVLSRVCERGLHKDPAQRFQSAAELEHALQQWFEGTAPIVCAGTCLQRVLSRWSYLIEQHRVLVPLASIAVVALFLSWLSHLVRTVWGLLSS